MKQIAAISTSAFDIGLRAAQILAVADTNMLDVVTKRWIAWQHEVVQLLEKELGDATGHIGLSDVDWHAWRPLFDEGRSARAAIDRALERDI